MANATAAAGFGLATLLHETVPSAWTSLVTFLASYLGEATTFVLLLFLPAYAVRIYNNLYFKYIYENGYHEKYRIQNDRRLPKILEDMARERTFGPKALYGIFVIAMPQQYLGYFVMNRVFGISVLSMPESWTAAAWEFFKLTFAWDTLLFFIHYGLHKIPWAYKNIHKKHHEVKTVSAAVSGYAYLIDLILSGLFRAFLSHSLTPPPLHRFIVDFVPVRFGMIASGATFPVLFTWNIFYTHIAIRAHCGYSLPWDPLNWFLPYVENHDFHHRRTHANYETFFFVWDYLFNEFADFWEWRAKRWDPAQWKDGEGFVNKADQDRDGKDAVTGDTVEMLAKLEKAKAT